MQRDQLVPRGWEWVGKLRGAGQEGQHPNPHRGPHREQSPTSPLPRAASEFHPVSQAQYRSTPTTPCQQGSLYTACSGNAGGVDEHTHREEPVGTRGNAGSTGRPWGGERGLRRNHPHDTCTTAPPPPTPPPAPRGMNFPQLRPCLWDLLRGPADEHRPAGESHSWRPPQGHRGLRAAEK